MNQLDPSKLTSVDEFGDRLNIIPAEVRGFFRKHRTWTQLILIAVFLILPWTTINGHQTIHLNIPDRAFALFGLNLKAHDAPLLFFVIATATIGLAFVTSVWGRVWCGWACPQTVFIDGVYRRIEQLVEGNYIQRRQLRQEPFHLKKILKLSTKWALFVLVSSLIAHSFAAYFVGAKELIAMIQSPPGENWSYFVLISVITAILLFDFAWFREQFCVIMCPYGRIQSVLMDRKSMAVTYNVERGEPRKGTVAAGQKVGDCVACNRCVQVCPTGIDIRNGLQMECINCTACIDACDEIMEKVKKPKGLIAYRTLDGSRFRFLKPRTLAYLALIIACIAGLSLSLLHRASVDVTLLRAKGLPYSKIADDRYINQFHLHITNQTTEMAEYEMSLVHPPEGVELIVGQNPTLVGGLKGFDWGFFIRFSPTLTQGQGKLELQLQVRDRLNSETIETRPLTILGPN